MEKIRFLATGDIHSDKNFMKEIAKQSLENNVDFIVLIGDISEKKNDFNDLLSILKNKKIFMIPGNHDTKNKLKVLKQHYNIHLIGNQPVKIDEDLVLFGSNYIPLGSNGKTEEEVLINLIENFESIKDVKNKIHLSHLPPIDTQISSMSPFFPIIDGSIAQRIFLDNFSPEISLVGHIHESSGLEEIVNKTKVINVGKTFKIFEFDKNTKELEIIK